MNNTPKYSPTHISLIRPYDIVLHNNKEENVCSKDIKKGFMGITLFGDSYRLGTIKVMKKVIK